MYAAVIDPFSLMWWKMNIGVLVIGILILMIVSWMPEKMRQKSLKYFGVFLLFDLFFFQFALFYMGSWDIHWALPLQYCTIMEFCAALVLITRWQWLYEVVLFLGMIGPIQALIAPGLPYEGNYFFYEFYISHSSSIFVPIFLTIVERMRPRRGAWWRSAFAFTLLASLIFCFNLLTHSNYMFLMEKPPLEHPFLKIGTWPFYLILWFTVLLSWSFLVQLLFWRSHRRCSGYREQ